MDSKKQKSIDIVSKRLQKLEADIVVPLDLNYRTILLQGQSPQYATRFAAWARTTLDKDEHMENLVKALLSHFATQALLSDDPGTSEFVRGQANGVLFLWEEMQTLSNPNQFISDKVKE
jgi:hypothetical protein